MGVGACTEMGAYSGEYDTWFLLRFAVSNQLYILAAHHVNFSPQSGFNWAGEDLSHPFYWKDCFQGLEPGWRGNHHLQLLWVVNAATTGLNRLDLWRELVKKLSTIVQHLKERITLWFCFLTLWKLFSCSFWYQCMSITTNSLTYTWKRKHQIICKNHE